jgi:hypothetical protein
MDDWNPLANESADQKRLDRISMGDVELKIGDRVRLRPLGRADIFDIALNGKVATIVSIEQDYEDRIHLALTVDDDPGNDFGRTGQPGHRFFFGLDEVEPIPAEQNT